MSFRARLSDNVRQNRILCFFHFWIFKISHAPHYGSRSMSSSGSDHGDVDSGLDSGEGGKRLTLINWGLPTSISLVAYCKSNGAR